MGHLNSNPCTIAMCVLTSTCPYQMFTGSLQLKHDEHWTDAERSQGVSSWNMMNTKLMLNGLLMTTRMYVALKLRQSIQKMTDSTHMSCDTNIWQAANHSPFDSECEQVDGFLVICFFYLDLGSCAEGSIIPTNHIFQINFKLMWVSHISMESGLCISVPYQIDVKWYGFSYRFFSFIWYWFFFYQQILILEDGNIYSIFYSLHISKKLS